MTFGLLPGSRDPARLYAETIKGWGGRGDVWVFGYASLIFATLWGWLFFREVPSLGALLGAAIIIVGGTTLALSRR